MATEFKVPELGEGVTSGTVAGVLVAAGDSVEVDQPLIELETGKSVVPVPATSAGTIKEILVKEGDEVQIGQAMLTFEGADSASDAPAAPTESGTAGAPATPASKKQCMATGMDMP